MHAQNGSVDERRDGKLAEHHAAVLPRVGRAVLALALVVEAVDLRDLP